MYPRSWSARLVRRSMRADGKRWRQRRKRVRQRGAVGVSSCRPPARPSPAQQTNHSAASEHSAVVRYGGPFFPFSLLLPPSSFGMKPFSIPSLSSSSLCSPYALLLRADHAPHRSFTSIVQPNSLVLRPNRTPSSPLLLHEALCYPTWQCENKTQSLLFSPLLHARTRASHDIRFQHPPT